MSSNFPFRASGIAVAIRGDLGRIFCIAKRRSSRPSLQSITAGKVEIFVGSFPVRFTSSKSDGSIPSLTKFEGRETQ